MDEVVRALRLVRDAPQRWPVIGAGEQRRFVLAHFPYSRVYRVVVDEPLIRVLAIAHHPRRPAYAARR